MQTTPNTNCFLAVSAALVCLTSAHTTPFTLLPPGDVVELQRKDNQRDRHHVAVEICLSLIELREKGHVVSLPSWVDEATIHSGDYAVEVLRWANESLSLHPEAHGVAPCRRRQTT